MSCDEAGTSQDGLLPEPDASLVRRLLQDSASYQRRWLPPSLCSIGLHLFLLPFLMVVTVTFSDRILSVSDWDGAEQRDASREDAMDPIEWLEREITLSEPEQIVLVPSIVIDESISQPVPPEVADGQVTDAILFEPHILPILKAKCYKCHGDGPKFQGKLDMRTLASLMKGGGDEGPGVTPGSPAKSSIWIEIADSQMPPKGEPKLTEAEKLVIEKWIKTGAKSASAANAPAAVPAAAAGTPGVVGDLSAEEAQLLQLVNKHRASKTKAALLANLMLMQVARAYASLLAKKGQLDDELDDLNTPKRVLRAGYRFKIVGGDDRVTANICGGQNFSPLTAFNLWLQSPPSEANFLDDYLETGIGIANDGQGMVYYYVILATPAK
jgi:uncharacterized protein YkwD